MDRGSVPGASPGGRATGLAHLSPPRHTRMKRNQLSALFVALGLALSLAACEGTEGTGVLDSGTSLGPGGTGGGDTDCSTLTEDAKVI